MRLVGLMHLSRKAVWLGGKGMWELQLQMWISGLIYRLRRAVWLWGKRMWELQLQMCHSDLIPTSFLHLFSQSRRGVQPGGKCSVRAAAADRVFRPHLPTSFIYQFGAVWLGDKRTVRAAAANKGSWPCLSRCFIEAAYQPLQRGSS